MLLFILLFKLTSINTMATPAFTGIVRPVTYAQFKSSVLDPSCLSCHFKGNTEGATPLDTYESAMSVKEWFQPIVFGRFGDEVIPLAKRMPPPNSPGIDREQKAILLLWFADGLQR
jgi:hypothetical protein